MNNTLLQNIFANAIAILVKDTPNADLQDLDIFFDIPKNTEHGDLATNICMRLAKPLASNPRAIAEKLIPLLQYDNSIIERISLAGAGFINIKFANKYYHNILADIHQQGKDFGKTNGGSGKSVNVEYVSANPTGLLHLGHGRNAAIGDTLANLYEWTGWKVTREYYFNNAGNQMTNLTKSIYARMMQICKEPEFAFPEDGYHGEYVKLIAQELIDKYGETLLAETDDNMATIKKFGEEWCFNKIKHTLKRMNINQDTFFNEDSLYKDGKIKQVLAELKEKGLSYEKDGAVWLALSKMGLTDDRVIVKSSGEPTYRLPDIAYHREKLLRNYDLVVDLFGSDHIATVPDVLAGVKALGLDDKKVKVVIHQFVTLTENGEQVKMSKRTGKSYTLDELLDDVGEDIVRFFLIMRGVNTHLEFDLSLAKEQSDKNPVFYLQYGYARICSIFDKLPDANIDYSKANLSLLTDESEIALIKQLSRFPESILTASNKSEPHILCEYLREVASAFHLFYHNCRIIIDDAELMKARLHLANVTRIALHNGLSILGVSAPEKM
ncbi:MAG: arginine--tRNA ligase [Ignavibacteria bacterium]|jgi:arginyl-tRNA synthetase|nr:arginine--tRNA ligase [Ignavibacteria bacterium]